MEKLAFNPMLRVFKDPELQQQMEANGYVIVPFYKEDEVRYLTEVFSRMHDQSVTGFFSSTFSLNTDYREKANEIIIQICRRPMEDLLADYKVWCGSFLVKASDANSALAVH